MTRPADLEIVCADADHWDDLVSVITSSPHARACWCVWPRCAHGAFHADAPENRDTLRGLVTSADSPGLLAYAAGRASGWCAFGPARNYPQYLPSVGPDVWAIACLLVSPRARGRGLGRRLIEAAVDRAYERGAAEVLGPPAWWQPEVDAAVVVEAFRACGFREHAPGARMPLLRRERPA